MSDASPSPDHKWSSDRPGSLPDHDALNRCGFAQRVAKELRGWRQKDSLVISLNGDWGSGKTTLVNLIRHYALKQSKKAKETLHAAAHSVAHEELQKAAIDGLQKAIELKNQNSPYAEIYVMSRGPDGKLFYDKRDRR